MTFYKLIKLATKYSEKYELLPEEKDLLLRIDNSDYHHLNSDEVKADERPIINRLLDKGFIRGKPPNKLFPSRYVVTVDGSYALGVFDYSDMH